jgi:GTP 3',8-cyclase
VNAAQPVSVMLGRRRPDDDPGALRSDGPLVDRYGRVHKDLRISITDRCNLRCTYCMPEDGVVFASRSDLLSFDELVRIARVARDLGVTRVRITGGEPLVRRGVERFIGRLGALGFEDLSLTTNGTELAQKAPALVAAGLHRVNISCDSLQPERFAAIRRFGDLGVVLAAMDAAEAAGLHPVKVNVVLLAGVNDDEIVDFAAFARDTGRIVRFIEYMPLDGAGAWERDRVVSADQVLSDIRRHWPLEEIEDSDLPAPATRYRFSDGVGEVGVIPTVTQPFCGTCDRVRVTADGAIRNCLFTNEEFSLRTLLRNGAEDEALAQLFRRAVSAKLPGHGINDPGFLRPARSMSMIGG